MSVGQKKSSIQWLWLEAFLHSLQACLLSREVKLQVDVLWRMFLNECCRVQKLRWRVKKIVKPQRVMTEISSLCSLSKGAFHIFSKTWRKMMRSIFRESNAGRQKTWTYKFIKLNITEFWRRHHAKEELNCRKRGNSVVEIGAHESFLCNICSSVVHRCFFYYADKEWKQRK